MINSNRWVVDASVALKWYFRDEEFLPQADSLLEAFSTGAVMLTAPSFIRYEISNAFVVAQRQGRLSKDQLLHRLQTFFDLDIVRLVDGNEVLLSALELTSQFPVVFYDALYLAVAQRLACNFVTADKRLQENTQNQLPWVTWIGDLEALA
jgi:predicted nucleic acid-binding protein